LRISAIYVKIDIIKNQNNPIIIREVLAMPASKNILVVIPMSDRQKEVLEAQAPGCRFHYNSRKILNPDLLQRYQIIIGNVPAELLAGASQLEWLQLNSAGANEYVSDGVLPKGTRLTNSSGAYGLAISEHMLGMLLSIQKKLHLYRDNQAKGFWHDEGKVTAIEGSRTLVVGLGDIGGEFARKMKALGSYTIGIRRHLSAKPDYLDELQPLDRLDDLLPDADIIALSLPETPETIRIMNRERLALLKNTAILLNVGRGNAVDTDALYDALESGHLGGAGLDVTDPEPLPPNHRLWWLRNAVITPHISGYYHLQATLDRIIAIATRNLGRFMNGQELENEVDFQTGYRHSRLDT
jgi:phosphoglycerate dehydrogenase-like enzyme